MLGTAGAFVVVLGLAGAPPGPEAALEILKEERCQTDLPLPEARAPEEGLGRGSGAPSRSPSQSPGESARRRSEGARRELEVPAPVISLPEPSPLIMTILVAVAGAVALAILLKRLPKRVPWPSSDAPVPKPERERGPRKVPLDEADRLAREGRFGEAIHALLLRALSDLGRHAAAPALTSREVARGAKLAQEARAALGALVAAGEWAHFGGKPAGAAEYEASVASYRRFREAWRAGA